MLNILNVFVFYVRWGILTSVIKTFDEKHWVLAASWNLTFLVNFKLTLAGLMFLESVYWEKGL